MRSIPLFFVLVFLGFTAFAQPATEQQKIEYLLNAIGSSDVVFIRNGQEYTPAQAKEHLRMKLGKAGASIRTADEFITLLASKSSFTGKPYLIRPSDGKTIESEKWLREKLAHMEIK